MRQQHFQRALHAPWTQFPDLKMALAPAKAMLVDHRYKDVRHIEESKKKLVKATLAAAADELVPAPEDCANTSAWPDVEKPQADSVGHYFFLKFKRRTAECTRVFFDKRQTTGAPLCSHGLKTLWSGGGWRNHGSWLYPALAKVAQKYLSIPATQARRGCAQRQEMSPASGSCFSRSMWSN